MDLKSKPLQLFESKLKELNASQCVLSHFTNANEKAMHTSYLISLQIAQSGQPHTIGESSVLPSIKDAVGVLFGDTYLKEIELIPLSNDAVARRIEDMAKWVEEQLINRVKGSKFFSLQLDESTDIQGLSKLIVFDRFVWNSELHEDILFCEPIIQGTSEEIFETLDVYVKSKELDWRNCVGICMGGARAMCCKNSGVVTRVLNQSPNASWTHCSIHREVLALKTISDDLKNVLNTAVKIINFIKSKPLQSRLFEKLCKEMGSCHKSLLFHSEVRWLSRGNMLTRLVELREEVATLATFIIVKEATPDEDLISMIVSHLDWLKESFDYYFSDEMKFCDKNI
ncbi:Zinc finger BED domain-containing protein 5 [Trichinella nelsoni]|uniref:Zinc finger BED domain-containing protein 5 n=1 Tax=Trichinella nelsoni TaxID=6336 RepID=A0A0V0REA1_9BILA|nr:Zinc finger BED domain-containing protein 5 [Trichinella nelsoni]KRX25499.1 Zinc finger BED domain-containing protein 5 [Trichinella nelsoni]